MKTKKLVRVGATTALVFTLYGCAQPSADSATSSAITVSASSDATIAPDVVSVASLAAGTTDARYDDATAVHVSLSDAGTTADGAGVSVSGSTVTISEAGCYVLSGSLNGQVLVNAAGDADVTIVLADASVSCATSAALRVKGARSVTLILAPGTENALATTGSFDDGNVDAALFVKAPLTICGTGSLTVVSTDIGITSRDTILLADGTLTVEAAQHTLWADDGIAVTGGSYVLNAGHDGMHVENDEQKGADVYLSGGTLAMTCVGDGIDAYGSVQVDDVTLSIDAQDQGIEATEDLLLRDGKISIRCVNEPLVVGGTQTVAEGVVSVS